MGHGSIHLGWGRGFSDRFCETTDIPVLDFWDICSGFQIHGAITFPQNLGTVSLPFSIRKTVDVTNVLISLDIFRLTPVYAFVLFFYMSLLLHFVTGPMEVCMSVQQTLTDTNIVFW